EDLVEAVGLRFGQGRARRHGGYRLGLGRDGHDLHHTPPDAAAPAEVPPEAVRAAGRRGRRTMTRRPGDGARARARRPEGKTWSPGSKVTSRACGVWPTASASAT